MAAIRRAATSPGLFESQPSFLQMLQSSPEDRPYSRGVVIRCEPVQVKQDSTGNVVFTTRSIPLRTGRPSRLSIPPEKFQSILASLEEDVKSHLHKYLLSQK